MIKLGSLLFRQQRGKLQLRQQRTGSLKTAALTQTHRCISLLIDKQLGVLACADYHPAVGPHARARALLHQRSSCAPLVAVPVPRLFTTLSSPPPSRLGAVLPTKTTTRSEASGTSSTTSAVGNKNKKPPSSPAVMQERQQRLLHSQIKRMFPHQGPKAPALDKLALSRFIKNQCSHLGTANLVSLFYNMGKAKVQVSPDMVPPLMSALARVNKKRKKLTADTWHDALTHSDMGKIFFSLKSFDRHSPETLLLVKTITHSVRALRQTQPPAPQSPSSLTPSPLTLASICSGLQHLPSSQHPEVAALLRELSHFLSSSSCSDEEALTSRAIGTALFGLKRLSSQCPDSLLLLDTLSSRIEASRCRMKGGDVAQALLGLKGMDSAHPVVKRALLVLAGKMQPSPRPEPQPEPAAGTETGTGTEAEWGGLRMSPKEVCMSLHSLMNKNSHHSEVRAVVRQLTAVLLPALAPVSLSLSVPDSLPLMDSLMDSVEAQKLQQPEQQWSLDSAGTGIALYGLRHMHSAHREVRTLLTALTPRISLPSPAPSAPSTATQSAGAGAGAGGGFSAGQHMSNALYGLQSLNGEDAEVLALVRVLAAKIAATPARVEMSGVELSAALYGLQRLPSCCAEVKELLRMLSWRVDISRHLSLTRKSFQNMIFGLQAMSSEQDEVRDLLRALLRHFPPSPSSSFSEQDHQQLQDDHQQQQSRGGGGDVRPIGEFVGASLYGLREMSGEHVEVRALLARVLAETETDTETETETKTETERLRQRDRSHADEAFSAQHISNALYGLQNMSSRHRHVRDALRVLTAALQTRASHQEEGQGQGQREVDDAFTSQGRGMCLHGLQHMSLDHEEVRALVAALGDMLLQQRGAEDAAAASAATGERAGARTGKDTSSYRSQYMKPKSKSSGRDEHVLGGLMLALYGVAGLHRNSMAPRGSKGMGIEEELETGKHRSTGDLFSLLLGCGGAGNLSSALPSLSPTVLANTDAVVNVDVDADADVWRRRDHADAVHTLLRAVRNSFEAEEDAAFGSAPADYFGDIPPFIRMKSVLNLRRNVNLLLYLLEEGGQSGEPTPEDVLQWLRALRGKCEDVFSTLHRQGHVLRVSGFSGDTDDSSATAAMSLNTPFEFRIESRTLNDFVQILAEETEREPSLSIATASPVLPDSGATLTQMSPDVIQLFLDRMRNRSQMSTATAEGTTFNVLLKTLLSAGDPHPQAAAAAGGATPCMYMNELGNVCYISNPSSHQFDVCLTHNEVLFGVDTDIVVRLYARDVPSFASSSSSSSLPDSFHRPPLHTFNVEVDGPFHSYPKKQHFTRLRDLFFSAQQSSSHVTASAGSETRRHVRAGRGEAEGEGEGARGGVRVVRLSLSGDHLSREGRLSAEDVEQLLQGAEAVIAV